MSPKLRYSTYVWTSNTSLGLTSQVVVAGNLTYAFNEHLTVGGGINGCLAIDRQKEISPTGCRWTNARLRTSTSGRRTRRVSGRLAAWSTGLPLLPADEPCEGVVADGGTFVASFDRTHEFEMSDTVRIGGPWSVAATWVAGSAPHARPSR